MPSANKMGEADFYIEQKVSTEPLYNMHHHRSFELYFMSKGQREYFIEDRFFAVAEGDLVLIPRRIFHRTAGDGGLRYLVHFSDEFLRKYFTNQALYPLLDSLPFVFRAEPLQQEKMRSILDGMLQATDEILQASQLYQLLLIAGFEKNIYVAQSYSDVRITQIVRYINENYERIDDIQSVADAFYLSKYHLCRYFKKNLGISLMSYLNSVKIREACRMIRDGYSNFTEIAIQCGYNSSSYFSKVFKNEKGISPSEYRKKYSKENRV